MKDIRIVNLRKMQLLPFHPKCMKDVKNDQDYGKICEETSKVELVRPLYIGEHSVYLAFIVRA